MACEEGEGIYVFFDVPINYLNRWMLGHVVSIIALRMDFSGISYLNHLL